MKAHYMTSRQRRIVQLAAQREADRQKDDISTRNQYIIFAAMIDIGLSARTINRIVDILPDITARYAEYKTEEIADYAFYNRLKEAGVKVKETKDQF